MMSSCWRLTLVASLCAWRPEFTAKVCLRLCACTYAFLNAEAKTWPNIARVLDTLHQRFAGEPDISIQETLQEASTWAAATEDIPPEMIECDLDLDAACPLGFVQLRKGTLIISRPLFQGGPMATVARAWHSELDVLLRACPHRKQAPQLYKGRCRNRVQFGNIGAL